MKTVQLYSHKGWFGICPVYVADLESDAPHLTPRMDGWFCEGLFWASHYTFIAFFTVADAVAPAWQPGFPIFVTEELLVPHHHEYEDTES